MTWAILFGVVAVVLIMAINGRGQVPWGNKMRRVHAGVVHKAEWMAPEDVVDQVHADYLAATFWMQEHMLDPWQLQKLQAANYLDGAFLRRFNAVLLKQRATGAAHEIGVLRSDHQVAVRHFSENGETCLVVDQQSQRRMATYDARTHERVLTQDLGDGGVVYRMRYDGLACRWKIDAFIQELPLGWGRRRSSRRIRELAALPPAIGRDN